MSRIGITPISIPEKTTVQILDGEIKVEGEKGKLSVSVPKILKVEEKDGIISVKRPNDEKEVKALHGTIRALIANAVTGVSLGWNKVLEIHGSGYKATILDNLLVMQLGYSHPVNINIPEELEVKVVKNTITISGIDKQSVGALAAKIRETRKPEPYKGKGIKYREEHINRKVGKALKASE